MANHNTESIENEKNKVKKRKKIGNETQATTNTKKMKN